MIETPRTNAAADSMERNHRASWPKVVEVDFAAGLEREIETQKKTHEAELRGVASLIADVSRFLEQLPEDLGRGSLNGSKVQLQERIRQIVAS